MGKSQKKKAMRRHNPVRVPDSHLPKGLASASASSSKTADILPILQKMESVEVGERKWACVAVSNLIQNDPSTRRLLQGKNVVGALISRLTDSEEEVVIEAVGALRNLCIDGGYDICAEMYNKNILTPLKTFIPKIATTLSQFLVAPKAATENANRVVYDFADNVITTLWCLSETSNKALNAINEIHLTPFLMSFLLSRDKLPLVPVISAAQCLYVLTDDNQPAIEDVRADASYISTLLSIVKGEAPTDGVKDINDQRILTLKVLSAGVLRNISPLPLVFSSSFSDLDKDILLPLLQPIISTLDLSSVSATVETLIEQQKNTPDLENLSIKGTPKSDHKSRAEVELEKFESQLRTEQLVLEILTGLCATLPDPEPDLPKANGGATDEEEAELGSDVEMDADEAPVPQAPFVDTTNMVYPLLKLVQPVSLSFPPLSSPSLHPPTTSALGAIHVCALECLNNLFLSIGKSPGSLAADQKTGQHLWQGVWSALGAVGTITGPGQERRQEMWDIGVGVLWGIGNIWKGTLSATADQITVLIQLCNAAADPKTKVKCIGTLECIAQNRDVIDHNRVIAEYLISLLPNRSTSSSAGTEPTIQALSALIDIYSDEEMPYDINFQTGGFLARLEASAEGVKQAVKAIDRRKEGGKELKRRGEEMWENLVAFIQYRKDIG